MPDPGGKAFEKALLVNKTNDINKLIIKNLIFIFYSVSSSGLPSSTSSISLKNAPSFKSYSLFEI